MSQLLVDGYIRELQSKLSVDVIAFEIHEACFTYYCASIQYPKFNRIGLPNTTPRPINNQLPKIAPPNELLNSLTLQDHILFDKINKKFGDQILDFYPDDILRFVQGYAHEEKREEVTYQRIKDLIDVGNEFNFKTILKRNVLSLEKETECLKAWPLFVYGYDIEGHPVFYDEVCNSKVEVLDKCFDIGDDFRTLKTFRFRFLKRVHNTKGIQNMRYGYNGCVNNKGGVNGMNKHIIVMDIAQFSVFNLTKFKNLLGDLIGSESNLYPNTLDKFYIINAPWYFRTSWAAIKHFAHPITQKKVEVLGGSYLDSMKKRIRIEQIPKKYGGKGTLPIKLGYIADIDNGIIDGDYSMQNDPIDLKTITCVKNKNY